jgi:hypothetical protein
MHDLLPRKSTGDARWPNRSDLNVEREAAGKDLAKINKKKKIKLSTESRDQRLAAREGEKLHCRNSP